MSARLRPGDLALPIVQAPLAGGPSTPALAAAVCDAGGLGFLAAGYRSSDAVAAELEDLRGRTARPFGLNLFAPPTPAPDPSAVDGYARALAPEAERLGAAVGAPRHDDDDLGAKLALAREADVAVVSFTFGCPRRDVVLGLQDAGSAVWVTVTTVAEARAAEAAGADALVVQGIEAGGHRGSFDDAAPGDLGLLALLQLVRATVPLDLVAAGGLGTGAAVAAVLAAGASAAALGTALMLTPEAGTSAPHRAALRGEAPTALTRAFTGRTARGVRNRFLADHADAPSAYPDVHHVTAPLRAAARAAGDADAINLWAGQAYPLTAERPAAEVVRDLAGDARRALAAAGERLAGGAP